MDEQEAYDFLAAYYKTFQSLVIMQMDEGSPRYVFSLFKNDRLIYGIIFGGAIYEKVAEQF